MKWITLKMHMIPIIFQEIDMVTEQYISLLTSIKKSEQEKEDTSDQQSSKKQFNEMREGVIFYFIYIYIYIDYKKNKRTRAILRR